MNDVAKLLVGAGIFLIVAGGLLFLFGRLGFSKVPGDIVYRRGNFTFFFPVVTSILLSIVLSLLFALFRRMR